MNDLAAMRRATGWMVVTLLLTQVLVELLGFLSPCWALWRHPSEQQLEHVRDLLVIGQTLKAWGAALYLVVAWQLAPAVRSVPARLGLVAFAMLIFGANLGAVLFDGAARAYADFARAELELLAGVGFLALIWHRLRQRAA